VINNLESYNKAQLIELVKTQIEEYQKLEKNLGLIKLGIEQQHKQLISCETALDERNDKVSLQASRIAELEKERDEIEDKTFKLGFWRGFEVARMVPDSDIQSHYHWQVELRKQGKSTSND